ncbi:MAG: hypothetical protein OSB25_04685 [Salibacteraceae bacterium]|nr:hypothetical protein [Salibacteraceae bacterium]|tara:strand:- start:33425 stop:34342 length:918 start_codon:yes stop_codon:yes gene_type:complete
MEYNLLLRKPLLLTLALLTGYSFVLNAQKDKKQKDIQAIISMAGCYNVAFKYTETFAPEIDYEMAFDYTSAAFEYAKIIQQTENKIVLQHLLIINDSMIIKHWRQDWTFEKTEVYRFDKNNKWVYEPKSKKEVEGKWTQEVYQVDDSPRYTGTATWTHVDGTASWYNKADSPLPRREYTKRSDYNVMKRGNRVQIKGEDWLHEQDNDKVIREDGKEDVLLVQEKGYNTYVNRANEDCNPAREWWAKNQNKWAVVRTVWEDVYGEQKNLELKDKVEDKHIYEHLFYGNNYEEKAEIEALIAKYVVR